MSNIENEKTVKFKYGTLEEYNSLSKKDPNTLYVCDGVHQIFLGETNIVGVSGVKGSEDANYMTGKSTVTNVTHSVNADTANTAKKLNNPLTIKDTSTHIYDGSTSMTVDIAIDASDVVSGILSIQRGGTGNALGLVQSGKRNGTALGARATCEGEMTQASGNYSHAEGYGTTASEICAHSEGNQTYASGEYSHAEGQLTYAIANESHAEGRNTTASGNYSHTEGNGTQASGVCAHSEGYETHATANESHAEGYQTYASEVGAHAEGRDTTANGNYSHAEGYSTSATQSESHAEGYQTQALGICAHSEGWNTEASGNYSHTEGNGTQASGVCAHSEGSNTQATGQNSHAEGSNTQAINPNSHTEGSGTKANGNCAHAEGSDTIATGRESHAEGYQAQATGLHSHAEGYNTRAKGYCSHAEGNVTHANGEYAHAEGYDTVATGNYSHAEGKNTYTTRDFSHVCGLWNKDSESALFIVGNGVDGGRSNAFRVGHGGHCYAGTSFDGAGADYAEFIKPWVDGNSDNEDRVGYFVTVKNDGLVKAEDGDYIIGITSGAPSVVGNADEDYYWRWERDEFNRIVYEDVPEVIDEFDEETGEIKQVETGKTVKQRKVSPDYDSSLQDSYIERKDRKEWDYVGMIGVIPVRDDGTCESGGFCKCGQSGIATKTDVNQNNTYYVLERVNDHVVKVVLR